MSKDETQQQRRTRLKTSGGWIGVDLDGTLAEYHGWPADGGVGKPVPLMVARVKKWLAEGVEVRIVTARVSGEGLPGRDPDQRRKIQEWCLEHVGVVLPVTCVKDFQMICLYDDRAVQIIENTGLRADGVDDLAD